VEELRQTPALAVLRLRQLQRQFLELMGAMLRFTEDLLPLGDVLPVDDEELHLARLVPPPSEPMRNHPPADH